MICKKGWKGRCLLPREAAPKLLFGFLMTDLGLL
jgi:hypothetical protein